MAYNTMVVKPFKQSTAKFFGVNDGLPSLNILCAAFNGETLWVGTDKGAAYFDGERFVCSKKYNNAVHAMLADSEGRLWVASDNDVLTADGALSFSFGSPVVALAQDDAGTVRLMTEESLYTFKNGAFVDELPLGFKAEGMAAFADGEVFVPAAGTLHTAFGKRARWFSISPDNSSMPHKTVQCVAGDKYGMVWVGTDKGLVIYDSHNYWLTKEDVDALTGYNVKKILFGKSGKRYVGTDIGLLIYDGAARNFRGVDRWLPAKEVTALAESSDGSQVWVGTKNGISCIETKLTTLAEKAEKYQLDTEKYNVRRGDYVTSRDLENINDFNSGSVDISDNDGLWTGCYLISQAYRYAVTGDSEALAIARRSMKAMLKLMKITAIPGFTARAIRRPGEHGYGNGNHEWHHTTDEEGDLEWKGETSSDEMVGHFVTSSLFFDLCADDEEKKTVSAAICAIVDHIISNNYRLHDEDGKPTTWANWNPADLNRSDRWYWEHGINSLEILSFLKIAHHMSGDEKYDREYKKLVEVEHYALNCLQHKVPDKHTCHIDDNLGFLISIPLLTYETDPDLRQCYLMGLRHHWEYERIERCPMFNLVYGALSGECCDLGNAVQSLCELPTELLYYGVENSCRNDLVWDEGQEEFGEGPQLLKPLPYDEKPLNKYDGNPFRPDGSYNSARLLDGTLFLMPYWLGRYYGMIDG